jgi:hypothetical protein
MGDPTEADFDWTSGGTEVSLIGQTRIDTIDGVLRFKRPVSEIFPSCMWSLKCSRFAAEEGDSD